MAAACSHSCAARSPTIGRLATQAGGGGSLKPESIAACATMSSAWRTMVPMASISGTTSSIRISRLITSTARLRRPHSRASNQRSIGQVDTTIIVAQMVGAMKGRSTHSVATISTPMKSTPSVVRVRSRWGV